MSATRRRSRLSRDARGATVVEFAMVAPVMGLLLLGAFDVAHTLYTRAVLQGIVQKTGRDSTLENATSVSGQAALDAKVKTQALALVNNATVTITRRYYRTFTAAANKTPEDWTDTNRNGRCDAGEPYQDDNRNGTWDADGASGGQGGAKDAVVYTVTMSFARMFPIYNFIGGSNTARLTASTVLKNQPYADQATYAAAIVRNCA